MTPELFNMIGGLLLLVCAYTLSWKWAYEYQHSGREMDSGTAAVGCGYLVLLVASVVVIIVNWAPLGQSLFGGGR